MPYRVWKRQVAWIAVQIGYLALQQSAMAELEAEAVEVQLGDTSNLSPGIEAVADEDVEVFLQAKLDELVVEGIH
jgi:hypothetical protein